MTMGKERTCERCGFSSDRVMLIDTGRGRENLCEPCLEDEMLERFPEYEGDSEEKMGKRRSMRGW